uniref:RsbT co-antagonist protein RsbRD N-terminal domain-containing protein n=1 Tax=Solibacter usitatus (strain Ellin6076) TaxID=234267 RepID=Q021N4_SOLUE
MISSKLVHLIESNSDLIIDRVIARIHDDPTTTGPRTLMDFEMRELAQDFLLHLGHWLTGGDEDELKHRAERLGASCFGRDTPLHRAVRALCLLREKMLDFAEEHMLSFSSIELYSEGQLNRRMGHFFDLLTIHLVLGYERALRSAMSEYSVAR